MLILFPHEKPFDHSCGNNLVILSGTAKFKKALTNGIKSPFIRVFLTEFQCKVCNYMFICFATFRITSQPEMQLSLS